jgi:hypothetical protein
MFINFIISSNSVGSFQDCPYWEVKEPTIILKAPPKVILSILAPSYLDQLKVRSLCSSQIHQSIIPLNIVQRWLNFFNCPRAGLVGGSNQWNEISFIFDKKNKSVGLMWVPGELISLTCSIRGHIYNDDGCIWDIYDIWGASILVFLSWF